MSVTDIDIDPQIPCTNRAGGHESIRQSGPFVCKYVNPKSDTDSGNNEIRFYETQLALVPSIKPFVPKYRGTKVIRVGDEERKYIILEDLTYKYKKPSVIDIKMGTRLVAENATPRQLERIYRKKFAGQEIIGCRMSGYRIYRNDLKAFVVDPDKFLRTVTPETFVQTFVDHYLFDGITVKYAVAQKVLEKLRLILVAMEQNLKFRFTLSSLLFIYEADLDKELNVDVHMIDFGHVVEASREEQDIGYLTGVKSLIRFMEQIVEKRPTHSPRSEIIQVIQQV
jgi:1D-myo-inositol-tetrakisphosphate 5-kinase/inositol-polyphosphate multikinase